MAKITQDTSQPSLREKFQARFAVGAQSPSQVYTDKSVALGMVNELNEFELMALTKRNFVKDPNRPQSASELQLMESATVSHREIVNNIADAERIKALDPNIKRVEQIVVSSIMSPNDLQDVDPEIVVNMTELDEDQKTRISELLSKFYCDIYGIRERMTKWVKEAHFRSGAGVTMILPEATLAKLIQKYDPDLTQLRKSGTESLLKKKDLTDNELEQLHNALFTPEFLALVKTHVVTSVAPDKSNVRASTEGIQLQSSIAPGSDSYTSPITYDRLKEELAVDFSADNHSSPSEIENSRKNYMAAIEAISLNFTKALDKKDPTKQSYVNIVDNPDFMRVGNLLRKKQQKKLHNLIDDSILGEIMKDKGLVENKSLHYQSIPIMDITPEMTTYEAQRAFPFYIDLPTESVIPVCVPGSRSEHIGYFVLVDSWGQPIEASSYVVSGGSPTSSRISVAYNAMYGEQPTESGIRTLSGSGATGIIHPQSCGCNKDQVVKIFNYVLDEMLKKKLSESGLNDISLGRYNSIAQCMLYRLLDKKETSLVFVPEKYITYMAFDYHADGTGKSRIEDVLYMESLKVSFMTASTLAAMKSAVPVKKVKLNMDQKQRNTLQNLLMLRDVIIQREKFSPSIYPATITSQILTQNLSIESGHPNAEQMSYTIEDTHREIPRADVEMIKELDNNIIIGLGASPSAVNETSEVQFARSLATTNLYHAKSSRQDQIVLESHTTKHVQKHLLLSSVLIYKIAEILDNRTMAIKGKYDNNDVTENKPTEADGTTTVTTVAAKLTPEMVNKVCQVIDNLQVKLCPPDVAPNDAQYSILTETIKRIAEYVDAVYPQEMATYGEEDLSQSYNILKSHVKASMIREVAQNLGFRGLLSDVPQLDNYVLQHRDKMLNVYGTLKGIQEAIKRESQARSKKQDQNKEESDVEKDQPW